MHALSVEFGNLRLTPRRFSSCRSIQPKSAVLLFRCPIATTNSDDAYAAALAIIVEQVNWVVMDFQMASGKGAESPFEICLSLLNRAELVDNGEMDEENGDDSFYLEASLRTSFAGFPVLVLSAMYDDFNFEHWIEELQYVAAQDTRPQVPVRAHYRDKMSQYNQDCLNDVKQAALELEVLKSEEISFTISVQSVDSTEYLQMEAGRLNEALKAQKIKLEKAQLAYRRSQEDRHIHNDCLKGSQFVCDDSCAQYRLLPCVQVVETMQHDVCGEAEQSKGANQYCIVLQYVDKARKGRHIEQCDALRYFPAVRLLEGEAIVLHGGSWAQNSSHGHGHYHFYKRKAEFLQKTDEYISKDRLDFLNEQE